ncbi:MAG TPA: hypothetical protein DCZ75_17220 [Geobacter sp.]|nr:hypothetical protein [Geobacter sp.]
MAVTRIAFLALLLSATQSHAAAFDTPKLSEPLATARFFDPDRFLTTAGVKYFPAQDLTLEPELGVSYRGRDWELHRGIEQSTHRLQAQAGGRLSVADTVYLSAAARFPMVTVESVGEYGGEELGIRPQRRARNAYDFNTPSKNLMSWSAEFGLRLSRYTDLTLYYDQTPSTGWSTGSLQQEERVGTRFIFRFK